MTQKMRFAIVVIGLAFCCWAFGGTAFAESEREFASPEIRSAIQKQLESRYADLLNLDKSSFNTEGDFNEAKLGEGQAVYRIEDTDYSLIFKGYEFPLMLGDEEVGTVEAENVGDGWVIFNISSSSDLSSLIRQARSRAGAGTFQYVNAPEYFVRGFYLKNGEDERFFDANTNEVYSKEKLEQAVGSFVARATDGRSEGNSNREAILVGGPSANAEPAQSAVSSSRVLIGAALAVLLIGAAVAGSKRLRKKRR